MKQAKKLLTCILEEDDDSLLVYFEDSTEPFCEREFKRNSKTYKLLQSIKMLMDALVKHRNKKMEG